MTKEDFQETCEQSLYCGRTDYFGTASIVQAVPDKFDISPYLRGRFVNCHPALAKPYPGLSKTGGASTHAHE